MVKLAERPAPRRAQAAPDRRRRRPIAAGADPEALLGLTVRDLDRQTVDRLRAARRARSGVLITRVEPMSASFDGGIERGTVLLEINRQPRRDRSPTTAGSRAPRRPGDILTLYVYAPELDQRQLKTVRVEDR